MKKQLLSLFTFLMFFTATLFGEVTTKDVLGSYTGNIEVYFDLGSSLSPVGNEKNVKVFTSLQENQKIQLTLKDFSITIGGNSILVGDIEVKDVTVDAAGNVSAPENILDHPELGKLPVNIKGTLTATSANLDINVLWVDGGNMPIVVYYKDGVKDPAGETGITATDASSVEVHITPDQIEISGAELRSYVIYAATGTPVAKGYLNGSVLSLTNLNKGVYLIHLNTTKGSINRKVIRN